MRKKSVINHSLSEHDFGHLSKIESDPRARVRLLMLYQFSLGLDYEEVARNNNTTPYTASKIRRNYWRDGLPSLYDKPRTGRKSKLAPEHYETFKHLIVQAQQEKQGGRLTGEQIVKLAKEHFNVDYHPDAIYVVLRRLGMSWITGRSQHPKADPEKQADFKKTL